MAWRRVGERGRSFGGGACFPGPCSPIVPLAALSRWLTVLPSSSPGHCGYSTPSLVARRRRRVTSFAFLRGARQRARLPTVQTTPPLAPGALYGAFAPQAATRTPTASSACGSVRLPPAARSPAACAPQAAARVKRIAIEGERAARSGRRERRVVYRVRTRRRRRAARLRVSQSWSAVHIEQSTINNNTRSTRNQATAPRREERCTAPGRLPSGPTSSSASPEFRFVRAVSTVRFEVTPSSVER